MPKLGLSKDLFVLHNSIKNDGKEMQRKKYSYVITYSLRGNRSWIITHFEKYTVSLVFLYFFGFVLKYILLRWFIWLVLNYITIKKNLKSYNFNCYQLVVTILITCYIQIKLQNANFYWNTMKLDLGKKNKKKTHYHSYFLIAFNLISYYLSNRNVTSPFN